mgnify:CR=1 FL=1
MTRDETEALLRSASSGDEWCDVRTWQSHDGQWYAWIACGSTDTEPSPAALEACGVGPRATESSALAWLVDSVASGCEKHAAQLQQEADHLMVRVAVLGEEIAALGVSASRLRAGIPPDATAEAPGARAVRRVR